MFNRINHVALVVSDLDQAVALYRDSLGFEPYSRVRNEDQGFEEVIFRVGDAHIELLAPTRPDSVVARFLEKRGPGLHHIGLQVDDIDDCMDQLRTKGLQLVSEAPFRGSGGSRITFIHPKSLLGAMFELVEPAEDQQR